MEQSRWKSPVLWVSIAAVIAFVLGNYGLYDAIGLTSETFQELVNLLLAAAAALGIINVPTSRDKF